MLFSYNGDKYIVWLKYGKQEELNGDFGFEFRTLYKCKEQRDLDKFNGLPELKVKLFDFGKSLIASYSSWDKDNLPNPEFFDEETEEGWYILRTNDYMLKF